MQDVARTVIAEDASWRRRLRDEHLATIVAEDADLLRRLGSIGEEIYRDQASLHAAEAGAIERARLAPGGGEAADRLVAVDRQPKKVIARRLAEAFLAVLVHEHAELPREVLGIVPVEAASPVQRVLDEVVGVLDAAEPIARGGCPDFSEADQRRPRDRGAGKDGLERELLVAGRRGIERGHREPRTEVP